MEWDHPVKSLSSGGRTVVPNFFVSDFLAHSLPLEPLIFLYSLDTSERKIVETSHL